jgi:hypothetical protein
VNGGVGVNVNVSGNGNSVNVNVGISTKRGDFDNLPPMEDEPPDVTSYPNDGHSLFLENEIDESNSTFTVNEQFNVTQDNVGEYYYDDADYQYDDDKEEDDRRA